MKRINKKRDEFDDLRALAGDLEAAFGPAWAEVRITEAGLSLPGWRRPFTAAELRSTFMRLQQMEALRMDNDRLRKDRDKAWEALQAAEDRAEYYRRQLRLESSLGAMLQRVAA